jgi:ABC-type transporter Mla MlaB component
MAEGESFFRKMVRFVSNPATEWSDLSTRPEDNKEIELEKSELKAMIERKRRNDFVRKREFDLLRRVRREGLSPDQLAALGTSSRLDDSEARSPEGPFASPTGVKAKIDEIEQQMVGEPGFSSHRGRPSPNHSPHSAYNTAHSEYPPAGPASRHPSAASAATSTRPAILSRDPAVWSSGAAPDSRVHSRLDQPPDSRSAQTASSERTLRPSVPPVSAPTHMNSGFSPLSQATTTLALDPMGHELTKGHFEPGTAALEVSEVVHDPGLDEAVISFANADFHACEDALRRITSPGGERSQHAETWLVLFDLYRATGQQQSFENLAVDYAQRFGSSAPQWYSLPQLVADAMASEDPKISSRFSSSEHNGVGWVCPQVLDIDAVARLRSQTLQMPLPWVLDWSALQSVEPEAAMQLSTLLRLWSGQALDMRWNNGERLLKVLQESSPTGVRDADPVYWLTRMDALRVVNRPDQFDEAAIDYCITYEVSPPSWEATRCKVQVNEDGHSTRSPTLSAISEMTSSFMESALIEDAATGIETAVVELAGQLVGDISVTLSKMEAALGQAQVVRVSCTHLIRVDFIAAGDLLNWVLSRRQENRAVHLVETHRLVALFFGAMGINEHAKVQVRKV